MSRLSKVSESTYTIVLTKVLASLLLLAFLLGVTGECGAPEQSPSSIEPVPVAPGPPPPPHEQILAPIPKSFDWMRREVRPNPYLESLLRLREVTPRLLMSISLIEEYSDNFFLDDHDREEEFRTGLHIGTVYRLERGRGFVSLANSLRGTYDALAGQGNFAFANLSLNAGYELPRLSLSLSESFIRSDEVEDASPAAVRSERRTFSQNNLSPQIRYALTPTTALHWAYTNTLVWNEDAARDNADTSAVNQGSIEGDSISHAFTAGLQQRLSRDLSVSVSYTFTMTDSEDAADTQAHAASSDVAYLINPRTNASFLAFGTLTDRRQGASDVRPGETDSRIFGVSFGVRRQLTTLLTAFVSVGPTLVDRDGRPTSVFANWQVSLDGTVPITRRTTLGFSTQQKIMDTAGDIDDVGLVLSRSAILTLNHAVFRDLLTSVFANFTQTQLLEDIATNVSTQDRDFTLWSTGARMSYALTPVWSVSATYRYQQRDSDVQDGNLGGTRLAGKFKENRVILSLSAAFPVF
jgi:opacity protein-like surface antigen